MSVKRLVSLNALQLGSNPTTAISGDIYFNTVSKELRVFDGTVWNPVGSGGGGAGAADTLSPSGFVNPDDSVISFNNSNRTFTIAPTSSQYLVYVNGVKYTKISSESVQIPNTSGLYYIHFNTTDGSLDYKTTFFNFKDDVAIAYIYWNATQSKAVFFAEERHGVQMDPATHYYLHRTNGTQLGGGLSISNYNLSGNGSNDSHAKFGISDGSIFDEDIEITITNSATPTADFEQKLSTVLNAPVFYKSTSEWYSDTATEYVFKQGTYPKYNLNTSGTWSTPDTPTGKFAAYWIVATNNKNAPVISIMGQRNDDNIVQARSNNTWQDLELTGLPVVEMRPLYRVIFEADTAFTNAVNARLVDIIDIRGNVGVVSGVSQNDHGNLYGLADDDHPQYVHIDNNRTINATHTFTASPVVPTPTTDYQAATKKYVDDGLSNLGNSSDETYVPISDVGNVDGVAGLDTNKNLIIPGSSIIIEGSLNDNHETIITVENPTQDRTITFPDVTGTVVILDATQTLTNKTISISSGLANVSGYDNIEAFYGQSNITVYQDGIDKGGKINISSLGVITQAVPGSGYTTGLGVIGGGTRVYISTSYNILSGKIADFNASLIDDNFATETNLNLKAPIDSPTFTGTVSLPSTTAIGTISSTELGYLDGVTSAIQTQIDNKLSTSAAQELIEDTASTMITGGTHTNITVAYNDTTGTLSFTGVPLTQEQVQDLVAPLLAHSYHTNLTATYDDSNNRVVLEASGGGGGSGTGGSLTNSWWLGA
jgi:hypothetical protein